MKDALAFGGAVHLAAQSCRSRQGRVPGAARQRHRADHDRDGRSRMAADDLLPVRRDEPLRTWQGARTQVESAAYSANYYDPRGELDLTFPIPDVPYLKVAAVNDDRGGLSLFLLNRHLGEAMTVDVETRSFGEMAIVAALQLADS